MVLRDQSSEIDLINTLEIACICEAEGMRQNRSKMQWSCTSLTQV